VVVLDETKATALRARLGSDVEVLTGEAGLLEVVRRDDVDVVISALVGFAGVRPTAEAIRYRKHIALANKETLVAAGAYITGLVKEYGVRMVPVDSEHSAILQCLMGEDPSTVARLVLTASGGPFLHRPANEFASITVEDALKHPNWNMGSKITIDSATLMNKGLEVIEARWLFNMPLDRIKVYVHPQSIVHAMLELQDGNVIAHLSNPDMKGPIAHALFYPEPCTDHLQPVNLAQLQTLQFLSPDVKKFPCLALAYQALEAGETMPAVLNGANEVAVHAFLSRRIGFSHIPAINRRTMELFNPARISCIDDVLLADQWARHKAAELIARLN
jgi:1-deoxy-D-xylulose-5-phosphate reductoisomerase